MANIGDDATAAGIPIMTGNEQAKTLDTEINLTRDEIARRGRRAVTPIAEGGTGATTASGARAALGAQPVIGYTPARVDGPNMARFQWDGGPGRMLIYVDSTLLGQIALTSDLNSAGVYEGNLSPNIYNRATSGQWRSLAVQSNGVLAQTASARRFKENIAPLDVTDEQLAALQFVTFDWIADGTGDVGVIADDVEKVLPWAVFHDDDGDILGVHYDRLSLALLPALQRLLTRAADAEQRHDDLARRVAAIEAHLDALGGDLDAPAH